MGRTLGQLLQILNWWERQNSPTPYLRSESGSPRGAVGTQCWQSLEQPGVGRWRRFSWRLPQIRCLLTWILKDEMVTRLRIRGRTHGLEGAVSEAQSSKNDLTGERNLEEAAACGRGKGKERRCLLISLVDLFS